MTHPRTLTDTATFSRTTTATVTWRDPLKPADPNPFPIFNLFRWRRRRG